MTYSDPLGQIVEVSRLLGQDPTLVLHGGGNTSIKGTLDDITGQTIDTVWVKGSGWDLATIEAAGFAPLRRERLLEVLSVDSLSDEQMANEIRQASLRADAPTASIEALLHALLPARVVLHSHADAIVALTNQRVPDTEALGDGVLVLPYVMPGFALAKTVEAALADGADDVDAIVLSNHGLFTFDDDHERAYSRHRELVARAEAVVGLSDVGEEPLIRREGDIRQIARLRSDISRAAGRPMILSQSTHRRAREWACRADVDAVVSRGTATPEHVIRTKREPLVGRDVERFAAAEHERFVRERGDRDLVELDPAPRVVLDPEWGMLTAGESVRDARIAYDVYEHTIRIVDAADALSGYTSLSESENFDIEYWSLEQAKLHRRPRPEFGGEVAVVTGAASGIGRAVAARLLDGGAAVVGIDLNPGVVSAFETERWCGVVGDVSSEDVLRGAAETAVRDFGGVDILVVAAGVFPPSADLAANDARGWSLALEVNATAVARAFSEFHPYLCQSPFGGRAVLVSTKNVAAPGPGAAAYSASKAAAAQLARVAALEWAGDGIRVNSVEPDAVFDTAIWTPELLEARAAKYGLSVAEYKTRNLLGMEVRSRMVADAVALFSGQQLPATTGAHLSVDGGNDRVI
ncbi:SDR family oxidoreductase [Microbacterium halotolerans]|uniref:SDR family oxidoreductase n=1 Tax=Microbacterium halotolerans TaxID=246613 RepID=UPI000E6AB110|nr:SDR family oxidoreductase [Microbacterium halotolerans]